MVLKRFITMHCCPLSSECGQLCVKPRKKMGGAPPKCSISCKAVYLQKIKNTHKVQVVRSLIMNRQCPSLQYLQDRDKWQTLPIHDVQSYNLYLVSVFNLLRINSLTANTAIKWRPLFLLFLSLDVANSLFFLVFLYLFTW